ncbi:hypothetical protein FJT64_018427 [Amphibalanus amphitrite]|uniref:Uncharacterized protein n=1 Tax=Amphibalanus amphitrite TaxID=1232801 RepID=A0A6A4WXN6_AMPAM|nr:hypothetical protein FJT64_018427 [Amphibalanus amphitrite]
MSLQFATIRDRHCAQVVRTKAFCQRTEQASQSSKVTLRKNSFRQKLRNRFKNCRKPLSNAVIDTERRARGIVVKKRAAAEEGMPGMFPKTKKSKLDICTETAKFSAKLKHADVTHKTSVLKESFEARRICLTSNRKTGEEMKEIFPDMYSEAAETRTICTPHLHLLRMMR